MVVYSSNSVCAGSEAPHAGWKTVIEMCRTHVRGFEL